VYSTQVRMKPVNGGSADRLTITARISEVRAGALDAQLVSAKEGLNKSPEVC
jgi:hypothetical protein